MTNDIEIWTNTKYPHYQVSTWGRVMGKTGRILSPGVNPRNGYKQISARDVQGFQHTVYVHLLVLESFVGEAPVGHKGRHLDYDKSNNRLDNLIWQTVGDNMLDQVKAGIHVQAAKTHCNRGHKLEEFNLVPSLKRGRSCLACSRMRAHVHYREKIWGEVWNEQDKQFRADQYYLELSSVEK